ncbi:MAG TPA: hypothetical protein VGR95_18815 [Thermoanaerobaculia bacterium]|jgi:hypothetical protein|nr:hypothetical protein [Thermoanaerobaculia bacterium]
MAKRKSKKEKGDRQVTTSPVEKHRERFEEAVKKIDERYAEVFRRLAKN